MGFVSRVVAAPEAAATAGGKPRAGTASAPSAGVSPRRSQRAEVVAASILTASEIARQSPVAVFGTKRNLLYARDHSVDDGLEYAATWSGAALQAGDLSTAMRAAARNPKRSSRREAGAGAEAGSHPRFSRL